MLGSLGSFVEKPAVTVEGALVAHLEDTITLTAFFVEEES